MAGVRYIPVMISRIMLSLRKAADSQHQKGWSLGGPSDFQSKMFSRPQRDPSEEEPGMQLVVYPMSQTIL